MAAKERLITLLLIAILFVYVLVGAAVFYAIENAQEQTSLQTNIELGRTTYENFLANFTCVSQQDLINFLSVAKKLADAGLSMTNLTQATAPASWSYSASTFFAMTIVTTVGYGVATPTMAGSQIFCCFYLVFGIPLCLVVLARIGYMVCFVNSTLMSKLTKWEKGTTKYTILSLALLLTVGFSIMVLLPCIMFTLVEGWTYGESIYFAFVTLSTVGFGDYAPGFATTSDNWGYRIVCMIWIMCGLAWFASIIGTIQENMTKTVDSTNEDPVKQDNLKTELTTVSS